jgi:hypothetical protein
MGTQLAPEGPVEGGGRVRRGEDDFRVQRRRLEQAPTIRRRPDRRGALIPESANHPATPLRVIVDQEETEGPEHLVVEEARRLAFRGRSLGSGRRVGFAFHRGAGNRGTRCPESAKYKPV